MLSSRKNKWLFSIILAAVALSVAFMGGKWGMTYASEASEFVAPHIDYIEPAAIPVGSPNKVIIIVGSDFNQCSLWVRLTAPGLDVMLDEPLQVLPDAISQLIGAEYFSEPKVYTLYAAHSTVCSIPVVPYWPEWDEISNPITLTVFEPARLFLPVVNK